MRAFLDKTIFAIEPEDYFPHLFFGVLFAALVLVDAWRSERSLEMNIVMTLMMVVLTPLYPYARFVSGLVGDFFRGDTVAMYPLPLFLIGKIVVIGFCFVFAWALAPIAWAYFYFNADD